MTTSQRKSIVTVMAEAMGETYFTSGKPHQKILEAMASRALKALQRYPGIGEILGEMEK